VTSINRGLARDCYNHNNLPTLVSPTEMSIQNTVKHYNGETLTGKLWRKSHTFFKDLPFYTEIPRMDDIEGPLRSALSKGWEGYRVMMVVR
jgi:hypothetical protein